MSHGRNPYLYVAPATELGAASQAGELPPRRASNDNPAEADGPAPFACCELPAHLESSHGTLLRAQVTGEAEVSLLLEISAKMHAQYTKRGCVWPKCPCAYDHPDNKPARRTPLAAFVASIGGFGDRVKGWFAKTSGGWSRATVTVSSCVSVAALGLIAAGMAIGDGDGAAGPTRVPAAQSAVFSSADADATVMTLPGRARMAVVFDPVMLPADLAMQESLVGAVKRAAAGSAAAMAGNDVTPRASTPAGREVKDGAFVEYRQSGTAVHAGTIRNGKLEGVYYDFDKEGRLYRTSELVGGIPEGWEIRYNGEGVIVGQRLIQNGREMYRSGSYAR